MSKTVEAVYENGVLRPLESLNLREHQRVTVIVSESPAPASEEEGLEVDCLQLYAAEADESISLEAVREALSKIPGSLTTDFIAEREEAWMADYFLDSSAVGKYYHTEVGTAEVDRLLKEPGARHFISRLTIIEVQSVFAGKVRTSVITESDFQLLRRRFLTSDSPESCVRSPESTIESYEH